MLCTHNETLAELIIRELSKRPRMELAELIALVSPRLSKPITLQAWYKTLQKLTKDGVIVKVGKRYSLNASWLAQILHWAGVIDRVYIDQEVWPVIELPTKANQKIVYRFRNPIDLDTFWGHLLVHIASQKKGVKVYAYNPHFWFYLGHGHVEERYNKSMIEFKAHSYIIVGSDSFLDKWNAKFFPKKYFSYWLSPKPLYPDNSRALNYIGGYFLEIKLHKDTAQKIHELFSRVKNLSDVSQIELISIFQRKALCTLTVSLASGKDEAFKRKIARHF